MTVHLIAYDAQHGRTGIANVTSDRARPSWRECASEIPGFVTGRWVGLAPIYTLTYSYPDGSTREHKGTADRIETIARVIVRCIETNGITKIQVLNESGEDYTFDIPAFRS